MYKSPNEVIPFALNPQQGRLQLLSRQGSLNTAGTVSKMGENTDLFFLSTKSN